jgi:hypothetical protein
MDTLRRDGAGQVDPARFHFLEALSRRIAGQPESVQRLLQARLHAGLSEYAERIAKDTPAGEGAAVAMRRVATIPPVTSGLAQLAQSARAARAAVGEDGEPDELASVRRFRRTWTSLRIQDQVDAAVARKPTNAGPLNSHVLMLQTLDLMRELSPAYLERFLAQVETLQWLEKAAETKPDSQGKSAKAVRKARKP